MKRVLRLVLVAVMTFTCCFVPTGCHKHSVEEWTTTTSPTCISDGEKVGYCTDCGEEVKESIPKDVTKGHDLEIIPENPALGLTGGIKCKLCNQWLQEQEPMPEAPPKNTRITMWGFGNEKEEALYRKVVEDFNKSAFAKENQLQLRLTWYSELLYNQTINNGSAKVEGRVDILLSNDRNAKRWLSDGNFKQLSDGFTPSGQISEELLLRGRYNPNGHTSYQSDALYGVPVDVNTSALYYNRSALENAGVIVISVENVTVTAQNYQKLASSYDGLSEAYIGRELLELWNQNLIADELGQYHDSCGERAGYPGDVLKTEAIAVPSKGYYRSDFENNYIYGEEWVNPNLDGVTEVVKVFNASIAMSWDEVEDLAHLLTNKFNDKTHGRKYYGYEAIATDYGFYTEDDINYIWSVGGEALTDVTGEGTWTCSLTDWCNNYVVTEAGAGYRGVYTGKIYQAGESLHALDKVGAVRYQPSTEADPSQYEGEIVLPDGNGGFGIYNAETNTVTPFGTLEEGALSGNAHVLEEIREFSTTNIAENPLAKFVELPSSREAYSRMFNLYGDLMPRPTSFNKLTTIEAFVQGDIAMVVEYENNISEVRKNPIDIEWGIAPIPVYKQYANPKSNDATVAREGLSAGTSLASTLFVASGSQYSALAEKVIYWMTAERVTVNGVDEKAGQTIMAEIGNVPASTATTLEGCTFVGEQEKSLNLELFYEGVATQRPHCDAYLPDNGWMTLWISPTSTPPNVTLEGKIKIYSRYANIELIYYSYYLGDDYYRQAWCLYYGLKITQ